MINIKQIDFTSFWSLLTYSFTLKTMLFRFIIAFIISIFPFFTRGQTIINAEQLILDGDSLRWSLQGSYIGNAGNASTHEFSVVPGFMWIRKKEELKVFGSYNALFSSNQRLLNSGFIHLRAGRNVLQKGKWYAFYQLQFNEILLMTKRELIGGGYRVEFIDRDSISDAIALGLMHEYELLDRGRLAINEKYKTNYLRLSLMHSFNWSVSRFFSLANVFYYQPYLQNFNDYRLLNDLRLSFKIISQLQFMIQGEFRYDNEAPSTLKSFDLSVSSGFNVGW